VNGLEVLNFDLASRPPAAAAAIRVTICGQSCDLFLGQNILDRASSEEVHKAATVSWTDPSLAKLVRVDGRPPSEESVQCLVIASPAGKVVSAGNLGLLRAVEGYDPSMNTRFSTYASFWIKQSMKRALANQSKTIRLPVHLVDKISRMRKMIAKLTDELGREPENEEIAAELQIPTAKVALLKTVSVRPASLDAPVGEDNDSATLGDLVGDDAAVSPYEGLGDKNLKEDLSKMVNSLDPREASIIKLRFGLEGQKELTLEEVGKKFKVTRERIRQLEYLALAKIRRQMQSHNKIRTADEVEEERHAEQRAEVIRDFVSKGAVVE